MSHGADCPRCGAVGGYTVEFCGCDKAPVMTSDKKIEGFDEAAARQASYDFESLPENQLNEDFYLDNYSFIQGASWQFEQAQSRQKELEAKVKELEKAAEVNWDKWNYTELEEDNKALREVLIGAVKLSEQFGAQHADMLSCDYQVWIFLKTALEARGE